jgi:hypothetical protein
MKMHQKNVEIGGYLMCGHRDLLTYFWNLHFRTTRRSPPGSPPDEGDDVGGGCERTMRIGQWMRNGNKSGKV